jgi:hypothetical protein
MGPVPNICQINDRVNVDEVLKMSGSEKVLVDIIELSLLLNLQTLKM